MYMTTQGVRLQIGSCFVIPEGLQIALFYGKGNIKCYGVLNAPQCLLINMFRSGKRKLSKSQTLQQCFVFYLFHLCSSLCLNFFNLEGTAIICEVAFEQQHPEPLFSNICVWPTSSITQECNQHHIYDFVLCRKKIIVTSSELSCQLDFELIFNHLVLCFPCLYVI